MKVIGTPLAVAAALAAVVGWVMTDEWLGRSDGSASSIQSLSVFASGQDGLYAQFTLCGHSPRVNCVVDGDTFWFRGVKIRIADINAPEISEPRCNAERQIGALARDRLLDMLNGGAFSSATVERDEDRYGRKLRTVWRSGLSLGEQLVGEGLASRWNAPRRNWCARD